MRTLFFIISVATFIGQGLAQNYERNGLKNNELKLNTFYLISTHLIYPELSYERIIGNRATVGLTVGLKIGSDTPKADFGSYYVDDVLNWNFSIQPYYRYYFSRKRATGFFLESSAVFFSTESYRDIENELGIGVGQAIGAKFMIKNSWSIDFVAGGGYNLLQESLSDSYLEYAGLYPRLAVTICKRF